MSRRKMVMSEEKKIFSNPAKNALVGNPESVNYYAGIRGSIPIVGFEEVSELTEIMYNIFADDPEIRNQAANILAELQFAEYHAHDAAAKEYELLTDQEKFEIADSYEKQHYYSSGEGVGTTKHLDLTEQLTPLYIDRLSSDDQYQMYYDNALAAIDNLINMKYYQAEQISYSSEGITLGMHLDGRDSNYDIDVMVPDTTVFKRGSNPATLFHEALGHGTGAVHWHDDLENLKQGESRANYKQILEGPLEQLIMEKDPLGFFELLKYSRGEKFAYRWYQYARTQPEFTSVVDSNLPKYLEIEDEFKEWVKTYGASPFEH